MNDIAQEVAKRRTFAIISHPDAGKTTLTEKLLLFGGAIQLAGTVKGRKASRHTTSDWMELEKQRGISVTTSVMQFYYQDRIINLLDTPGHADFTEDTYRTLTAVDSVLMVIDAGKGVEARTIKLMEVCRLRNTPIITFINKMDRDARDSLELLDEIERILGIQCAPMTWPIGMGRSFKGVYHLLEDHIHLYEPGSRHLKTETHLIPGFKQGQTAQLQQVLEDQFQPLKDEIELVQHASSAFNRDDYLAGQLTPVFFGSAINNFGVHELLDAFVEYAPSPLPRITNQREVQPTEPKFSGFVFKIQANMDPAHRDRIAFVRISSGNYHKGIKLAHLRTKKTLLVNSALTFMASDRQAAEDAWPGDIIGIHSHGGIQIGDTFTEGENFQFMGIPNFAPELFRLVVLKDPLKQKALQKGLQQLSEEGATQIFRPLHNNQLILGAVGILQFEVVAYRLKNEYSVECVYENINVVTARWIHSEDKKKLEQFKIEHQRNLAMDGSGYLAYLAPSHANLSVSIEQWPDIQFSQTREH